MGRTAIKPLLKVEGLCMHTILQLYKQVKKRGDIRYLKCYFDHCDGSAKLQAGEMSVGVSEPSPFYHTVIFFAFPLKDIV